MLDNPFDTIRQGSLSRAKAFPKFNELPFEVRSRIWEASIVPRIVGIVPFQYKPGCWSLKSTKRPPAAMHVCREARTLIGPHYSPLEVASGSSKDIDWFHDFPVLDTSPIIPINFSIDTLRFVDTAPLDEPPAHISKSTHQKPTHAANALDLLILREGLNIFGPGMTRWFQCQHRALEWSYILEGKRTEHLETIRVGDPLLKNWTYVRYVQFDFAMFLSKLAQYWSLVCPFHKWLFYAAKRIDDPESALLCCDLVMIYGGSGRSNRQRVFRLTRRPPSAMPMHGKSLTEQLSLNGAMVFEDIPSLRELNVILFEVVDAHIDDVSMLKWWQAARGLMQDVSLRREEIYPPLGSFAEDLSVFWKLASRKRGFAHGEIAPVHGLCLANYGVQ